jgi:antitoxin Phd
VEKGPQVVTRRGIETAVLVPIEECRLQETTRPDLKSLLLSPKARTDLKIPKRGRLKHRPVMDLE